MTIFDPAHAEVIDSGVGRGVGFLHLIGIGKTRLPLILGH